VAYPSPDLDRRLAKATGTLGLALEAGMAPPDLEPLYAIVEHVLDLEPDWLGPDGEPTGLAEFSNLVKRDQGLLVGAEAWWAANGDEAWARALAQGRATGPRPA
jgi:hypothetical protein